MSNMYNHVTIGSWYNTSSMENSSHTETGFGCECVCAYLWQAFHVPK